MLNTVPFVWESDWCSPFCLGILNILGSREVVISWCFFSPLPLDLLTLRFSAKSEMLVLLLRLLDNLIIDWSFHTSFIYICQSWNFLNLRGPMSICALWKIASGLMDLFSFEISSAFLRGIFSAVCLQEYQMCPEHRINAWKSSIEYK